MTESSPAPFAFTTRQLVFLAGVVALDFAFGLIVKTALTPTGVLAVVRLDMFFPVMLMLLARTIVDRFGTLIVYELAWGALAVAAMPGAFGLPGALKLAPALAQGAAYDLVCSGLRRFPTARLYLAAAFGGAVGSVVVVATHLALGVPWAKATIALFGMKSALLVFVSLAGAAAASVVWRRVKGFHLVKLLAAE